MSINDMIENLFNNFRSKNGFLQFLFSVLINSVIVCIPFEFLGNLIPEEMKWLNENAIVISLITGFAISIITHGIHDTVEEAKKKSMIISAIIMILILLTVLISSMISTRSKATINEILAQAAAQGLSQKQIEDLSSYLQSNNYITLEEFQKLSISNQQSTEILKLLKSNGYLKEDDVISIIHTQEILRNTEIANATATALFTTCFIENEEIYPTISVHKLPLRSSEVVGYLVTGQRFTVISGSKGTINLDKFWLINLSQNEKPIYGWVSSTVVKEINEPACILLPVWPGS